MSFRRRVCVLFCLGLLAGSALWAQGSASLRGQVLDPSGAGVPKASVTVTGPLNTVKVAETDNTGNYTLAGLPNGAYTVRVAASGFALFEKTGLDLLGGRATTLDANLTLASEKQEVTVTERQGLDLDPANNAGAIVLKGEDLEMFSDDPDDLQAELLALAGPAAGPNGGQIFIDGFSDGQLPPKSQIREIRINSNPFSAEYDRVGFGRIEVFTKPGTDKFRGNALFDYGNNIFNARNPYSTTKPPFESKQFQFNLTGPLTKKSSFNMEVDHRSIDETAFINAIILDSNYQPLRYNTNISTPNGRWSVGPRIDYALTKNITLVGRYTWNKTDTPVGGIGGFNLLSRATSSTNTQQSANLTETQIIGSSAVNESRFQWQKRSSTSTGVSTSPTISVLDSFTGGGASASLNSNSTTSYEFQNYTSITRSKHFIKFGIRARDAIQNPYTTSNYNGTFSFTSLASYAIAQQGLAAGWTFPQIQAAGGAPSQYTVAGGTPSISVSQWDASPFFQDDWRVRPNMTLSMGLRYEIQTNVSDHRDFAPRLGLAWGVGKTSARNRSPKTVIRAGYGFFYDRVGEGLTLDALRQNGIVQQNFVIPFPAFYPVAPPVSALIANKLPQNLRIVYSGIQAPQMFQGALGVDRQLPKNMTLSINYTNTRGIHQLRSRNINAPLPGTYTGLGTGVYPLGAVGPLYMYESSALFKQSQLTFQINARVNSRFNLFGYYSLGDAHSNADSSGGFPANQYDLSSEWSRAGFDIRQRIQIGGSMQLPLRLSLSPTIQWQSANPFNIYLGKDLNGDSILTNDRPAFASSASLPQNVRVTPWGTFDLVPQPGETIIPRNYGSAYDSLTVGFRLGRSWGFGERAAAPVDPNAANGGGRGGRGGGGFGGGGGRGGRGGGGGGGGGRNGGGGNNNGGGNKKYNINASMNVRNALNSVNPSAPNGNLSSLNFGQSLSAGGGGISNRRVDLSVRFQF